MIPVRVPFNLTSRSMIESIGPNDIGVITISRWALPWYYQYVSRAIPHTVISFHDPDLPPPKYERTSELKLVVQIGCHDLTYRVKGYVVFDRVDAKGILTGVVETLQPGMVIVCQCEAGISRSAGTAAAMFTLLTGDVWPEHFFASQRYHPNQRIYEFLHTEWFSKRKTKYAALDRARTKWTGRVVPIDPPPMDKFINWERIKWKEQAQAT